MDWREIEMQQSLNELSQRRQNVDRALLSVPAQIEKINSRLEAEQEERKSADKIAGIKSTVALVLAALSLIASLSIGIIQIHQQQEPLETSPTAVSDQQE